MTSDLVGPAHTEIGCDLGLDVLLERALPASGLGLPHSFHGVSGKLLVGQVRCPVIQTAKATF